MPGDLILIDASVVTGPGATARIKIESSIKEAGEFYMDLPGGVHFVPEPGGNYEVELLVHRTTGRATFPDARLEVRLNGENVEVGDGPRRIVLPPAVRASAE